MTVKELKEKLNHYPDYVDVFLAPANEDEYTLLESAVLDKIVFKESTLPKKEWPKIKVVVLSND